MNWWQNLQAWWKRWQQKPTRVDVIFLLGPSGAGKTTHARLYRSSHQDVCLIRVSHLLREVIRDSKRWTCDLKERLMARDFEKAIREGTLTDPDQTWSLIEKAFAKAKNGFVIVDGYPRNLDYYQRARRSPFCNILGLLYLDVSPEEAHRRMSTQGDRPDNNAKAMLEREKFVSSMAPVLEKFAEQNQLQRVNGNGSIEVTQADFARAIADLKNQKA